MESYKRRADCNQSYVKQSLGKDRDISILYARAGDFDRVCFLLQLSHQAIIEKMSITCCPQPHFSLRVCESEHMFLFTVEARQSCDYIVKDGERLCRGFTDWRKALLTVLHQSSFGQLYLGSGSNPERADLFMQLQTIILNDPLDRIQQSIYSQVPHLHVIRTGFNFISLTYQHYLDINAVRETCRRIALYQALNPFIPCVISNCKPRRVASHQARIQGQAKSFNSFTVSDHSLSSVTKHSTESLFSYGDLIPATLPHAAISQAVHIQDTLLQDVITVIDRLRVGKQVKSIQLSEADPISVLSECQSRPKSEDAMSSMSESSIHSNGNPSGIVHSDQTSNADPAATSDYNECVTSVIISKPADCNEEQPIYTIIPDYYKAEQHKKIDTTTSSDYSVISSGDFVVIPSVNH